MAETGSAAVLGFKTWRLAPGAACLVNPATHSCTSWFAAVGSLRRGSTPPNVTQLERLLALLTPQGQGLQKWS